MSERVVKAIYVYQPFGIQDGKERWDLGRIYGVEGHSWFSKINGLTKKEAEAVAIALKEAHEHSCECLDASGRCMITGEL